jgi:hypothetical protein
VGVRLCYTWKTLLLLCLIYEQQKTVWSIRNWNV